MTREILRIKGLYVRGKATLSERIDRAADRAARQSLNTWRIAKNDAR